MNVEQTRRDDGLALDESSRNSGGDDALLELYLTELEGLVAPSPERFLDRYASDLSEAVRCELLQTLRSVQLVCAAGKQLRPDFGATFPVEGNSLGDFQIVRPLGRGGMGVVFLAKQISLDRTVALKILLAAGVPDPSMRARFQLEARAAAALHHPHIVPVYAIGDGNGVDYYAMQFIEGQTLQQRIRYSGNSTTPRTSGEDGASTHSVVGAKTEPDARHTGSPAVSGGAVPWKQAVTIALQIAEALSHAHRAGIVHRDIKPSNILLDRDGKAWLTDFGLAHLEHSADLTAPGTILGSLRYMSPEQLEPGHRPVDHRVDVYGLGVTLYEIVTGQAAIQGGTRNAILRFLLDGQVPSPRRLMPELPRPLETVILTAMAADPANRYASMNLLASDLRALIQGHPIAARKRSPVVRAFSWVQRNRMVAGLAAALFLALTTGLVFSVLAASRLSELATDRQLALDDLKRTTTSLELSLQKSQLLAEEESAARKEAGNQAENASRIKQFLLTAFSSPDPERDGKTVTIFEQVQSSLKSLEQDQNLDAPLRIELRTTLFDMFDGLGLVRESIPVAQQLTELCAETWGREDSRTFYWLEMTGNTQRDAGELEPSRATLERALAESRRLFGDDDHQTLTILVNLSITLDQLGQKEASEVLLAEAASRSEVVLDASDQVRRFALRELAFRLVNTPRNEEAIKIWERELQLEDADGSDDEGSIRARLNLGGLYRESRQPERAEVLLREAFDDALRILGMEHSVTANAGNNLAWALYDLKRLDESTEIIETVHDIYRATLGPRHPRSIKASIQLAERLRDRREFSRAYDLATAARQEAEAMGDQALALAVSATDLVARLFHDRASPDEESETRSAVVSLKSRLLGESHFATLDAMNQLAMCQLMNDDVHAARAVFEKIAELDLASHPPNPERRRMRLRWLHTSQLQDQDFEAALESIDEWARLIAESSSPVSGESVWCEVARLEALLGLGQFAEVIDGGRELLLSAAELESIHLGRLQNIVGAALCQRGEVETGLERMMQGYRTLKSRLDGTADQFRWHATAAARRIVDHFERVGDSGNREFWAAELEVARSLIAECRIRTRRWVIE